LSTLQNLSLRLTELIESGIDMASQQDPGQLTEIACHAAHKVCNAQITVIGLFDPVLQRPAMRLSHSASRGLPPAVAAALATGALGAGAIEQLCSQKQSLHLRGAAALPALLGLPADHPPVDEFLGVPIVSQTSCHGWMYLANRRDGLPFSEIDERAAVTVAAQLATNYENLLLLLEVRRSESTLQSESTQRIEAEQKLHRILRARVVMTECNRVMVHATDETSLFDNMCDAIVQRGGYRSAWIGLRDSQDAIVALAQADARDARTPPPDQRVTEPQPMHIGETELARQMLRGSEAIVIDDIGAEVRLSQWHAEALQHGLRSALFLPLREQGHVFGVVAICEGEPKAFDETQIATFGELTKDIIYGVLSLRTRRMHLLAAQALRGSQEKLETILTDIDNAVWSTADGKLLYLSPAAE
jgi:GAF domain-containing protein